MQVEKELDQQEPPDDPGWTWENRSVEVLHNTTSRPGVLREVGTKSATFEPPPGLLLAAVIALILLWRKDFANVKNHAGSRCYPAGECAGGEVDLLQQWFAFSERPSTVCNGDENCYYYAASDSVQSLHGYITGSFWKFGEEQFSRISNCHAVSRPIQCQPGDTQSENRSEVIESSNTGMNGDSRVNEGEDTKPWSCRELTNSDSDQQREAADDDRENELVADGGNELKAGVQAPHSTGGSPRPISTFLTDSQGTCRVQEVVDLVDVKKGKDVSDDESSDEFDAFLPILDGKHIPSQGYGCEISRISPDIVVQLLGASESQTIRNNVNLPGRLLKYTAYENKFMSSLSLAESGFIPLDQEPSTDAVVCVWCCLTLRDFTEPVDAVAVHQTYSYDCEYLRVIVVKERRGSWQLDIYDMELEQPTAVSTNVENDSSTLLTTAVYSTTSPLVPDVTQLQEMSDLERYKLFLQDRYEKSTSVISRKLGVKRADSMKYESCRRETFTNTFFNEDEGSYMAASGLLWKKSCVACGFCNWRWNVTAEEDIPSAKDITEKHLNETAGRNCQFNSGKNIPAVLEESVWQGKPPSAVVPQTAQLQLLGVNTHFSKHAEFAVIDRRVATFLTYPYGNGQSCDELAEAGYYYAGNGDEVTCFSCGVVSSNWLTAEIPWQRHARSSPSCQYLAGMKGTNFANQVIEQLGSYSTAEPENRINTITTRMIRPRMESPAVQGALARGLDRSKVRDVISRRIQRGENDFRYTAEIVKAVHDVDVPSTTHTDQPKLPSYERPEREERNTSDQTEEGAEALENVGMDQDELDSRNDAMDAADEMRQTDAPRRTSGDRDIDPLEALMTPEAFRTVSSQLTCKICLSEIVGIGFLPCGHLVCCIACAAAMVQCPLCRRDINGTFKVNMPQE